MATESILQFIPIPVDVRDINIKHREDGAIDLGDSSIGLAKRAQAQGTEYADLLERISPHVLKHPVGASVRIELGVGQSFRAERYRCRGGVMTAMRRMPEKMPAIDDLNFPHLWRDLFMAEDFCTGGLIVVVAPTGSGKSVTLGALGTSRLARYGGYMTTIEDPIEMPLHGWHGAGKCVQTEVDPHDDPSEAYVKALRAALRAYPTAPGGGTILLFGEIRDQASAAEVLRAANQGHLVLTTLHGSTIESALRRLISMATRDLGQSQAQDLTAAALRLIVTQKLHIDPEKSGWEAGTLSGELLYSSGEKSPAAGNIRDNDLGALAEQLDQQARFMNRMDRPSVANFLERFKR